MTKKKKDQAKKKGDKGPIRRSPRTTARERELQELRDLDDVRNDANALFLAQT